MNKRRLAIVVIVIGVAAIAGTTATYALAQTKAGKRSFLFPSFVIYRCKT